jgi:hypothetical protein
MRKFASFVAAGLMMATAPALAQHDRGEAELERALEGRVPGEPVNCINMGRSGQSQIIDHTAILFRVGGTIYVNRPRAGAESLDRSDTLINRQYGGGSRLCSVDTMQTVDLTSGAMTGIVFLGDFVPYRRASSRY